MQLNGKLQAPAASPLAKVAQHPLNRRPVGPQSWYGHLERVNSHTSACNQNLYHPACSLVTRQTDLSFWPHSNHTIPVSTWRVSSQLLAWKNWPSPQTQQIQPCSVSCWWVSQSLRPAELWMQHLSLLWTLWKQKYHCIGHKIWANQTTLNHLSPGCGTFPKQKTPLSCPTVPRHWPLTFVTILARSRHHI
jgi:hypothetical protein